MCVSIQTWLGNHTRRVVPELEALPQCIGHEPRPTILLVTSAITTRIAMMAEYAKRGVDGTTRPARICAEACRRRGAEGLSQLRTRRML